MCKSTNLNLKQPTPKSQPIIVDRLMKRYITTGDATSLHNLGCHYYRGRHGLPKSNTRAMELWQRAGELGHSASYYNIARVYQEERSDEDMASRYYALAAVGGYARTDCRASDASSYLEKTDEESSDYGVE